MKHAGDVVNGAPDRAVVVDRSGLPLGIESRVLIPKDRHGAGDVEPLLPHGSPAIFADDEGVGRRAHDDLPLHGPHVLVIDEAATPIVNVVQIALLGSTRRDDRLQSSGGLGRCLKCGE